MGKNYSVATFKQIYKSKTIDDTGHKKIYLKRDNYYNWKIVAEVWSKEGVGPDKVAFRPSNQFFNKEENR